MGILVISADFEEGKYSISQEAKTKEALDDCISIYEAQYLMKLLGKELYDLFVADLVDRVPQTAKYVTIYNSFTDEINGCVVSSFGMKRMIKALIYSHFVNDQSISNSPTGNIELINETSTIPNNQLLSSIAYNEAVRNWDAIQSYIIDNNTDYSEFNGQTLFFNSGI